MLAHRPSPLEAREHQRWIVAELDARGEIDAHAALCLRNALEATDPAVTTIAWIDLRDLLALPAGALVVLAHAGAGCRRRGIELGVLLSGHPLHDPIADVLAAAGLRHARSAACDGGGARAGSPTAARAGPALPAPHAA